MKKTFTSMVSKNKREKLELPLAPENKLVRWANTIRGFYGHPVYLVGSQLTGKKNPRDVDVVCAIPDDEFTLRYGNVNDWMQQGGTGLWTEVRWTWSDDCIKKWKQGCLETGLNIDFKVQPMCQFKGYSHIHKKFPPYKLDTHSERNKTEKAGTQTAEEINKNHYEYKNRLQILRKHLGDTLFYSSGDMHNAIDDAMREYAEQFRNQDGWISVEERLPADSEYVSLIGKEWPYSETASYWSKDTLEVGWHDTNGEKLYDATHWQPLPEKPNQ